MRLLSVWWSFYTSLQLFCRCFGWFGLYEFSSTVTLSTFSTQSSCRVSEMTKPNEFVFISDGGNEIWSPQQQNLPTLAEFRNYHLGTTEEKSEPQQNKVLSVTVLTERRESVCTSGRSRNFLSASFSDSQVHECLCWEASGGGSCTQH